MLEEYKDKRNKISSLKELYWKEHMSEPTATIQNLKCQVIQT